MDDLIGLSLWAMALGLYLLPTLVARLHEHHQLYGIAALNVLLGWTLLGWIGTLVLALKGEEPLKEKKKNSSQTTARIQPYHQVPHSDLARRIAELAPRPEV